MDQRRTLAIDQIKSKRIGRTPLAGPGNCNLKRHRIGGVFVRQVGQLITNYGLSSKKDVVWVERPECGESAIPNVYSRVGKELSKACNCTLPYLVDVEERAAIDAMPPLEGP